MFCSFGDPKICGREADAAGDLLPMICIHLLPGSWSDRWIQYCTERQMPFLALDLFEADAFDQLRESGVQAVLFDLPIFDAKATLAAKSLVTALESSGIQVFPNASSYWHHDDKLAQSYLFRSLEIPACPTYLFYERQEALDWAHAASYPKVWKLRNGASSANVRLIHSADEASRVIRRAFGRGFSPVRPVLGDFKTKLYRHRKEHDWTQMIRRLPHTLRNVLEQRNRLARERGYALFQDFLPGNEYDTRITVIGERAFGFRRFVRPNDFRASGSGRIDWDAGAIDLSCVRLAFEAAAKIGSQCLAFDFVYAAGRAPVILEVCYRFVESAVHECPGFWDRQLVFHHGNVWPQDAIMEDLLTSLRPCVAIAR